MCWVLLRLYILRTLIGVFLCNMLIAHMNGNILHAVQTLQKQMQLTTHT